MPRSSSTGIDWPSSVRALRLPACPSSTRPGSTTARRPGVVLANEFLDALPVHVVEVREGRPREVHVGIGCDGAFEDVLGELSDDAVATRLEALGAAGIALAEGQRLEVRPAVEGWAREVGRRLAAGLVLVLDYGAPAADLYGPRRPAGTLMTYRGHVAESDPGAPYLDIGERDITAHVDTTALGAALAAAGLDLLGETSQAELLVGCGLEELVQRRQAALATASEALELRSAVMRLLDPRHLGGFRAVLAGRGIAAEPPLRGLAYRMPGRAMSARRRGVGIAGRGAAGICDAGRCDRVAPASRQPNGPRPPVACVPTPPAPPRTRRGRRAAVRSPLLRCRRTSGPPGRVRARVSPELPAGPADPPRIREPAGRREVRWKASGTSSASPSRASRSSS